jgi:hypothetical protein
MTHHDHRHHHHGNMDWDEGDRFEFRGPGGGQPRFGQQGQMGQREYGGWASGEGQGEFAGEGYSAQGQLSNQRVAQYGDQGYDHDYGRQGIGWQNQQQHDHQAFGHDMGWEQGPSSERAFRGERRFTGQWQGPYGPDPGYAGSRPMRTYEGYGGAGSDWQQESGGYWGQGSGGGQGLGGGGADFSVAGSWMVGPHSGRGPRGYQRSDARIEEDVNERLTNHGMLDATGIQVRVENGEVTLTGTVESRQAKRLAEDILDSISGVKDIHNQLRVQRDQDHQNPFMAQTQMDQGDGQGSNGLSQGRGQSRRNGTKAGASSS